MRDMQTTSQPGSPPTSVGIAAEVGRLLRSSNVVPALAYLNARTRFRFTGIYRVEPPLLRNLHLFDRENPALNVSGNAGPLEDTYCSITARSQRGFSTPDALADRRLDSHAARDSVISYCGIPIRMEDGRVWGTLCHFDVRPRLVPPTEVPVLESVVTLFAEWVQRSAKS